tara:strand:+ start:4406 stop:5446 length:1041 start_codon:yes stop_codon:yes gene_type:complete
MIDVLPISFLVGCLLIFIEKLRNKYGIINLRKSIQTIHTKSVSRFGGLGIFLSLAIVSFFSDEPGYSFLRNALLCISPIFLLGMMDDLNLEIKPILRLLFVFPTAFLSYYFLNTQAYSLDIPFVDHLFNYKLFSIFFICFAISGMVNAFNMIDGINGLVLLLSLTICVTVVLSTYSFVSDELNFFFVALLFSILGIFILNFPFGRIFLGDGGAYLLGAALSIGLIRIYQENDLSPWYVLTMLIYPFTDFMSSLIRRVKLNTSALNADNKHFHHLIIARLKKTSIKSDSTLHFSTTIIIFFLYLPFLFGANYFAKSTSILMLLCVLFILIYFLMYLLMAPKDFNKKS